jgi:coproporphyrinogen III oxidase-like Fe-S oxidoreductase
MYTTLYPVTYYFYPLLEGPLAQSEHAEKLQAVLRSRPSECRSLLYVHVPYCHDLCRFCPFHVRVANGDEVYGRYARALCAEMRMLAELPCIADRRFDAVYFGGGSPSVLPVEHLRTIFTELRRRFRIRAGAELSFEGEPRTLSDEAKLDLLREFGFQRISFGLQTYDEVQRERFNIAATLVDVERCAARARKRRFADVNVDMMYDLPGQTLSELRADLARLGDAGFDSVDYYNLHYFALPSSFRSAQESGTIPPRPDQLAHFALFEELRRGMVEMGYPYVGDQVFSRSGALCDYFKILWGGGSGAHEAETVAIGASARGFLGGLAYMNESEAASYLSRVEQSSLPIQKVSAPLEIPENRGAAFMMKFLEIDKSRDRAIRSLDSAVWSRWQEWRLIEETPHSWRLTQKGQLWTTNMMLDSFEGRQRDLAQGSLESLNRRPGARTGSF